MKIKSTLISNGHLIGAIILLIIGGIFIISGISKILSQSDFTDIVLSYDILPESLARIYSVILPWAELIVGVLMVLRIYPRIASLISIPIVISFVIAHIWVVFIGDQDWDSTCGCFGESVPLDHTGSLIMSIVMLVLIIATWIPPIGPPNLIPTFYRRLGVPVLSCFVIGAVLFTLIADPINTESISSIGDGWAVVNIDSPVIDEIDASLDDDMPALVFFYSDGCPVCAEQKPIVEKLEAELADIITVVRVNYEEYHDIADAFDIKGTPTILFIHEKDTGNKYKYVEFSNYATEDELRERMADYLGDAVADTTAPGISEISVGNITDTTATVSWTTDEPATSQVEYGTSVSYGQTSDLLEEFVTDHVVVLAGFESETTYHFKVKSKDSTGNEAVSGDYAFKTIKDTRAPEISGVAIDSITDTTVTVSWITDELATSNIVYGLNTSYGSTVPASADTTADKTSHSLTINGLSPDTVYHFKVKSKDRSGNEAVSEDYAVKTTGGTPDTTPPVISGVNINDVTDTTVTISWTTDEPATSNIEYGLSTSYGSSFPAPADTTADKTSHILTIRGLSPNTTFHFRVISKDALGFQAVTADDTFTTDQDSTPPEISGITISGISDTTVTISWTTDEQATSNLEYGLNTGYGSTVPAAADTTADNTSHSLIIDSLSTDTIYHFKVKSKDSRGNEAISEDYAFKTTGGSPDSTPPVISNVTIDDITDTTVTISWTTDEPATSDIGYGFTSSYGYSFPSPTDDAADKTSHILTIVGLSPNTTYHFQVKSKDSYSNPAASADDTFTTHLDSTPPVISDVINIHNVTDTSVTISWTTSEPATGNIDYGLTTSYGISFPNPADTTANNISHTLVLSGLTPDTSYHFRVKSEDSRGNEAISEDRVFTTAEDSTPPVISNVSINNSSDTEVTISWTTNELATGNIDYGLNTSYGSTVPASKDTVADLYTHVLTISGLSPDTTYYFRIKSEDSQGNEAMKNDTFSTVPTFSVTTMPASHVCAPYPGRYIATVSGNLESMGGAASVGVYFRLGTAPGNYTRYSATLTRTAAGYFSDEFGTANPGDPALEPNTTYYFQAVAKMGDGTTVFGAERTFITNTYPTNPAGQIYGSVTLSEAYYKYTHDDLVIIRAQYLSDGGEKIAGTDFDLSPT